MYTNSFAWTSYICKIFIYEKWTMLMIKSSFTSYKFLHMIYPRRVIYEFFKRFA